MISSASVEKWREQYQFALEHPPGAGDELPTIDGKPIRIDVELVNGSPPFLYTRMYVPEVVGSPTKWYALSVAQQAQHGWMCIVLPHARKRIISEYGIGSPYISFTGKLVVVRESRTKKSMLVEVR